MPAWTVKKLSHYKPHHFVLSICFYVFITTKLFTKTRILNVLRALNIIIVVLWNWELLISIEHNRIYQFSYLGILKVDTLMSWFLLCIELAKFTIKFRAPRIAHQYAITRFWNLFQEIIKEHSDIIRRKCIISGKFFDEMLCNLLIKLLSLNNVEIFFVL